MTHLEASIIIMYRISFDTFMKEAEQSCLTDLFVSSWPIFLLVGESGG